MQIELPSGNLANHEPRYRQNTHSFKINYRDSLIHFRIMSSEIDEVSYEWRQRLNDEIEDLDNEIDPVTIKDFTTKS